MNLLNLNGLVLMPSANCNQLLKIQNELNAILPNGYKDLLKFSNGLTTEAGVVIYGTEDIVERNETWETKGYAQGYIAIGDDSGGRVFLMHQGEEEKAVLIVDSGDMTIKHSYLVTSDIGQWVNGGFSIELDKTETDDSINRSEYCKVVLVDATEGGLKDLLKIKKVLGLSMTTADLLKGTKNLPFTLADEYPYGKAKKLLEKLENIPIQINLTN